MTYGIFWAAILAAHVCLGPDEPDRVGMSAAQWHTAVATANTKHERVALNWMHPGCRGVHDYMPGTNILILDWYPFFQSTPDDTAILRFSRQSFEGCARVARRYGVKLWLTLQAFGPGLSYETAVDRWRCPSVRTFRRFIAAAVTVRPDRVLFWYGNAECPSLAPIVTALTGSGA